jgi:hypothetical protein
VTTLFPLNLQIFAGSSEFIGMLNDNELDLFSIANPLVPYGNTMDDTSIWNPIGTYGSADSEISAWKARGIRRRSRYRKLSSTGWCFTCSSRRTHIESQACTPPTWRLS